MIDPQNYSTSIVGLVPPLFIECAWCLQEMGQEMGNGSHGICSEHAERLLAQRRSKRNVATTKENIPCEH